MNITNMPTTLVNNQALEQSAVYISLQQKVFDKLRKDFVELLPEEQLTTLTNGCLDEFLNGPRAYRYAMEHTWLEASDARNPTGKSGSYFVQVERPVPQKEGRPYIVTEDPATLPGMLTYMLRQIAQVKCVEQLGLAFGKDGKTIDYNNSLSLPGGQIDFPKELNTAVKDWLDANVNTLISGLFGTIIHNAMNGALMNIRNGQQRY